MKKLYQTRLHEAMYPVEKRGNCFPTVIACIMDLESPEDAVQIQEFYDDKEWFIILLNWLESRGWYYKQLSGHLNDGSYYFVTGETDRGSTHICIYKNGKLYHDPHPEGKGLTSEVYFEQIYK